MLIIPTAILHWYDTEQAASKSHLVFASFSIWKATMKK